MLTKKIVFISRDQKNQIKRNKKPWPLGRVFLIFFFILLFRLITEFLIINFFLKKEVVPYNEPSLYNDIFKLKYSLIDKVKISFEGLEAQDLEKITVHRFSFKNRELNPISLKDLGEDYFFYSKLALSIPKTSLAKVSNLTVFIGNRKFPFTKEQFLKDWQVHEEENSLIFTAPPRLKNHSIITNLVFFSPKLSSIINWNPKVPLIFFSYLFNQLILPLLLILIFWTILEKTTILGNEEKIRQIDFIKVILTTLTTIIMMLILLFMISLIYKPDLTKIIQKARQDMIFTEVQYSPEPVERLQYLLSIFFLPVFIVISFRLVQKQTKKLTQKNISQIYNFLQFFSSLSILALANFWWLRKYENHSSLLKIAKSNNPGSYLIQIILLSFLCLLLIFLIKKIRIGVFRNFYRFGEKILVLAILLLIIITHTSNFNRPFGDYNHFDLVLFPMTQVMNGKALLVNFINMYGLYPHFLEPIFRVIGFSVLKFTLVMSFLLGLSFLFIFLALKKNIRNKFLGFLGFVSLIYFNFIMKFNEPFDPYFQFWPIRFLFPSFIIFLVSWYLKTKSKKLYYLIFIVTAIAILWNLDTGIVVFFAWLLTVIYKTPKKILKHIFWAFLILIAAVSSYSLYIYLRFGALPNFSSAFFYQQAYYISGFYMEPMKLFDTWNLVILVYVLGMIIALKNRPKPTFVFFLSILGLGVFSYYQGRSHYKVLPNVIYPAVFLLTIFADKLWSRKLLLPFITIFFIMGFSLFCIFGKIDSVIESFKVGLNAFKPSPSSISENIDFIKSHTKRGEKIILISSHLEGIYYAETGTVCAMDKTGFRDSFLKSDFVKFAKFLETNRHYKVFYDADIILIKNSIDPLGMIARKLLANYRIKEISTDGQFWFMVRKL